MRTLQRQKGMSMWMMLLVGAMAGFYALCAVKLIPVYSEYLTVRDILTQVSDEFDAETTTIGQMRRRIENLLNVNQVYGIKTDDIEIYRKSGKTYIDGSYEGRVTVVGRLDVVLRFDDLQYVAGQPNPQ